jgi:hypothetical protein
MARHCAIVSFYAPYECEECDMDPTGAPAWLSG